MANGFIKVRVMADGKYTDCWQRVAGGQVTGYVATGGEEISPMVNGFPVGLPDPHEIMVLRKEMLDAPNDEAGPHWKAQQREDAENARLAAEAPKEA